MKAVIAEFVGKRFGNGDLGDGPVLTGGHALDGTERVTVVESDGLGPYVEVVTADRGDRLGAVGRVMTTWRRRKDVELRGRGDGPLGFAVSRGGECGELQCAVALVECGPQNRVAGVVEDDGATKDDVVHAVVRP